MELSVLIHNFNVPGQLVTIIPIGGGNINDTFLAIFRNAFSETQVILQRINAKVFPRPDLIMANMHMITRHAHRKLAKEILTSDRVWQLPKIVPTRDGKDFYIDDDGIEDGKMDGFKVMFDCGNEIIPEDEVERIEKWVEKGGVFVAYPLPVRRYMAQSGVSTSSTSRLRQSPMTQNRFSFGRTGASRRLRGASARGLSCILARCSGVARRT